MEELFEVLSARFLRFSQGRAVSTPLYSHLARRIAEDVEIPEIAAQAASTPVTNLFLSAIQYLLGCSSHPLRNYYPTYCDSPLPTSEAWPCFRSFCLDNRDAIIRVIQTRRTQTNEVRRCGYVATGFALAVRRSGLPLSIIDVGSSAGLHLLWREFRYKYGQRRIGEESSKVEIAPRLEGALSPWLPAVWPETVARIGIDLLPLRVTDVDDCAWLCALVWPEHPERLRLLNDALGIAQAAPPPVLAGDALDLLPEIALAAPHDSILSFAITTPSISSRKPTAFASTRCCSS